MDIVFIGGSLYDTNNGPYHSLLGLAVSLRNLGHNVFVFGTKDTNNQSIIPTNFPINNTYALNQYGPYSLHFTPGIRRALKSLNFKPDIIICQSVWMYNCYLASKFSIQNNIPYIISIRGNLNPHALLVSKYKKYIAKFIFVNKYLSNATALHALNNEEKDHIDLVQLNREVFICPNGVFLPNLTSKVNNNTLLYLGRIDKIKNIEETIYAFARANKSTRTKWKFLLAGTGEQKYTDQINKIIISLKMTKHILLTGFVSGSAKENLFLNSSAFILESFSEGMPMAVIEAMSYGIPIIASKNCNVNFIEKENIGWINNGKKENIVNNLQSLMNSSCVELEIKGFNARQYIINNLSWETISKQFENHLLNYINK